MFAEDLKRTEKMTVDDVFEQSAQKMREQGMSEIAISQFRHAYHVWASEKESAWIREDAVEPLRGGARQTLTQDDLPGDCLPLTGPNAKYTVAADLQGEDGAVYHAQYVFIFRKEAS
jgi:hypothetical protein